MVGEFKIMRIIHYELVPNLICYASIKGLQYRLICYENSFSSRLAYKQGKKEKPPFVKSDSPEPKMEDESKKIPAELLCSLCQNLLVDAVLIPCCGNSFCDECKNACSCCFLAC